VKLGGPAPFLLLGLLALHTVTIGAPSQAATAAKKEAAEVPAPLEQNIFTVAYPEDQKTPFIVPCSADESVLIVVPFRITGWAGRGFLPQGDVQAASGGDGNTPSVAGDFELIPGKLDGYKEFAISALVDRSDRTLHILMDDRILTLEFIVVPNEDQAFRRIKFVDTAIHATAVDEAVQAEHNRLIAITRSDDAPESLYTEPTAETQEGLRAFARALLAMNEDQAKAMIAANPAIQASRLDKTEAFGDFTILQRYAIRDAVTDTLAVVVALRNDTKMKLFFEPRSWVIRAGVMVYPVPTSDFAGVLDPDQTSLVVLLLARDQSGRPTRLLPSSPLRISIKEVGKGSTKPVSVDPLEPNGR
jgi:hypothetical protein